MPAPGSPGPKAPARSSPVADTAAPRLRTPAAIRTRALCTACAAAIALSGCFFYPRQTATYDPQCRNPGTSLRLESEALGNLCHLGTNTDAGPCIAVALAVTAASALVSGTIVVMGNSYYWLEERAKCAVQPRSRGAAPDRAASPGTFRPS